MSLARRTLIESDWFRARWGNVLRLTGDQNQKREFRNTRRGTMIATSVGGTATGKGGNRIVIDDPVNPQQAESEALRLRATRWFNRTIKNRLNNMRTGAIVLVMQRLHEDDLSGLLVNLGFEVVSLPALAEEATDVRFPSGRAVLRPEGDALWPFKHSRDELEALRDEDPYAFSGQYQQRPVPEGGGTFRVGLLKFADDFPPDLYGIEKVRAWDKASTPGGAGARTAGVLMWKTPDETYWIVDVVKGRWSFGEREETILNTAKADGYDTTVWIEQEPGSGGKESFESTARKLAGFDVRADPVRDAKHLRWRPLAAQIEAGNVHILRRPWTAEFVNELSLLPHGSLKDQADAASGAFAKLALGPGRAVWGRNPTDHTARPRGAGKRIGGIR